MVATQQPEFAAALCVQHMFPVDIVVPYLSEDKALPEAFVTDLRAGLSKFDSVAPINFDRASEALEDVDCSGMRYVEQEQDAPTQEEEEGDTHKRPAGKGSSRGGEAHQLRQNNQSPMPMALPRTPPPAHGKTCGPQGNECL